MIDYIKTELKLAKLLGYYEPFIGDYSVLIPLNEHEVTELPSWCRTWHDCGELMVDHNITWCSCTMDDKDYINALSLDIESNGICELVSNHKDVYAAVRYTIVLAVIDKLDKNS